MTSGRELCEADLNAYLDGELTRAEAREVEALLAADDEAAVRLEAYRYQRELLKDAYGPVAGEALPVQMTTALDAAFPERAGRWQAGWLQMAAALVLFAAGGLAGWSAANGPFGSGPGASAAGGGLVNNAISAHVVYAAEVRHPVEVGIAQKAHLVKWLSKRLGHALKAPDLSGQGFALVGGRLLPDASRAAAQFMYEDASGKRITLYVARNPSGKTTSFRLSEKGPVKGFYWLDGTFGYALAGEISKDRLMGTVRAVYDQMGK